MIEQFAAPSKPSLEFTGERFLPEIEGSIALEHLHRYLMAREYCTGKEVLDIACGEGYGSAILAECARFVYGVDISPEAVAHATSRYPMANLEYRVGEAAAIPLPDSSVDLVVSFETIEHHTQHQEMVNEIRRVLRPSGLLIISSPDKREYSDVPGTSNPYHAKELYREEFEALLHSRFPEVALLGQRVCYGSVLASEQPASAFTTYENVAGRVLAHAGIPRALYWIAFASNDPLPPLLSGLFEESVWLSEPAKQHALLAIQRGQEIEALQAETAQRGREIETLQAETAQGGREIETLKAETAQRFEEIDRLRVLVADSDRQLVQLRGELCQRDATIAVLRDTELDRKSELLVLRQAVAERNRELAELRPAFAQTREKLATVIESTSWQFTKPVRLLGRIVKGEATTSNESFAGRQANRLAQLVARHVRARHARSPALAVDSLPLAAAPAQAMLPQLHPIAEVAPRSWGVIATRHTLFVGEAFASRLRTHGWSAEVLTEVPALLTHERYIVICPQMFGVLPPGERRIAVQLEQSVSPRWFTDEYLELLNSSMAVLDYAQTNLEFLANKGIGYPHVHYLPIGVYREYGAKISSRPKTCDVLFYGDSDSCLRRRELLDALSLRYNVREIRDLFGIEMMACIKEARIVINLHYYENALLEIPRIAECLSLGVPVVSESARDQDEYPEFAGAVRFFKQGSITDMMVAVHEALENPVPAEVIEICQERSAQRFQFMFDRFLVAAGILPPAYAERMIPPLTDLGGPVVLSLPETVERRKLFEAERIKHIAYFDGIRCKLGWMGCAMSYSIMARHALRLGKHSLCMLEDDVLLPNDFEQRMVIVQDYLDGCNGQWNLFSGLIADLHPDVKILRVDRHRDVTFVTLDRMTSTVFNIYSESVMRILAGWNPFNEDAATNTIDRYLEAKTHLRVVVTLPYLVGHREDTHSTLWGFSNRTYREMIQNSEERLTELVKEFEAARASDIPSALRPPACSPDTHSGDWEV